MYFQAKKHFKKQPLQHFQTPPKSMMLGVGQKKNDKKKQLRNKENIAKNTLKNNCYNTFKHSLNQ
jgi:hypothetical protein